MSDITFYEDDILAWSEQQAAALRRLVGRRDLPNELDLEHVAEEIEDVGRSELNTVRGLLRQILVHLIKAASMPDASARGHWGAEVATFHDSLLDRFSPSMTQRIDLHREWRRALRQAAAALAADGRQIAADLPIRCPYDLAELTGETFSFDDAVATLNASRPT
jgi:DNA-binding ferritin-like protein (Dps family)